MWYGDDDDDGGGDGDGDQMLRIRWFADGKVGWRKKKRWDGLSVVWAEVLPATSQFVLHHEFDVHNISCEF